MKRKYRESYAVDVDGRLVVCTDGHISADADLAALIKYNVRLATPVRIVQPHGAQFKASLDPNDRLGTVAALMSPAPGRARILTAPDSVIAYLDSQDVEVEPT